MALLLIGNGNVALQVLEVTTNRPIIYQPQVVSDPLLLLATPGASRV